jgi:hypothetical protein
VLEDGRSTLLRHGGQTTGWLRMGLPLPQKSQSPRAHVPAEDDPFERWGNVVQAAKQLVEREARAALAVLITVPVRSARI